MDYEKDCLKCGECCKKESMFLKCIYLKDDNKCSIYNSRPEWCLTVLKMKEQKILPKNCIFNKGD